MRIVLSYKMDAIFKFSFFFNHFLLVKRKAADSGASAAKNINGLWMS